MKLTTCSSCGATIFFVTSASSGKLMPIDAKSNDDGNVVIYENQGYVLKKGQQVPAGTPRYFNHFVTCPQRQQHRKRA